MFCEFVSAVFKANSLFHPKPWASPKESRNVIPEG